MLFGIHGRKRWEILYFLRGNNLAVEMDGDFEILFGGDMSIHGNLELFLLGCGKPCVKFANGGKGMKRTETYQTCGFTNTIETRPTLARNKHGQ